MVLIFPPELPNHIAWRASVAPPVRKTSRLRGIKGAARRASLVRPPARRLAKAGATKFGVALFLPG